VKLTSRGFAGKYVPPVDKAMNCMSSGCGMKPKLCCEWWVRLSWMNEHEMQSRCSCCSSRSISDASGDPTTPSVSTTIPTHNHQVSLLVSVYADISLFEPVSLKMHSCVQCPTQHITNSTNKSTITKLLMV